MIAKTSLVAAACLLALAACGGESDTAAPTMAEAPADTAPAEAAAPAAPAPAAPAASDAGAGKPAAVVADCATTVGANDAMQFDVGSITVPASCSEFTITLQHTGQMPVAAMGHNVVVSLAADREGIAADGMGAGVDADYVMAGDTRVIAHTALVGGGESTSVTFPVDRLQGDGPYEFFCSFPGHWAVMRGTIQVGG